MPNNIEIRELREDGGGYLGFWAKGHHDSAAFLEAARKSDFWRDDCNEEPFVSLWMVKQTWWRCVPVGGEPGAYTYRDAEPKSRGAFRATYFNLSDVYYARWEADKKWNDADAWKAAADYSLDRTEVVFRCLIGRRKVGSLIGLNREDAISRYEAQSFGSFNHLILEQTNG